MLGNPENRKYKPVCVCVYTYLFRCVYVYILYTHTFLEKPVGFSRRELVHYSFVDVFNKDRMLLVSLLLAFGALSLVAQRTG